MQLSGWNTISWPPLFSITDCVTSSCFLGCWAKEWISIVVMIKECKLWLPWCSRHASLRLCLCYWSMSWNVRVVPEGSLKLTVSQDVGLLCCSGTPKCWENHNRRIFSTGLPDLTNNQRNLGFCLIQVSNGSWENTLWLS